MPDFHFSLVSGDEQFRLGGGVELPDADAARGNAEVAILKVFRGAADARDSTIWGLSIQESGWPGTGRGADHRNPGRGWKGVARDMRAARLLMPVPTFTAGSRDRHAGGQLDEGAVQDSTTYPAHALRCCL
jgi:hypothetical protein